MARAVSNLNPANAITALRFATLPPFLWAISNGPGYCQIATLSAFICGVLDLFDGAVARALKCTTTFGEIFDAITDALCYGFFLVVLVAYRWVPWEPVAVVLAMSVANVAMRAVYSWRAGRTVNYRSWAMERLVGYAAYLAGFGSAQMEVEFYYWVFTALMAVVLVRDAKRMLLDPVDGAPAMVQEHAA
jgi:phosphatidylglycerophosphate synthase